MILFPIKYPDTCLSEATQKEGMTVEYDLQHIHSELKNMIEINQSKREVDEKWLNYANLKCVELYNQGKFKEALNLGVCLNEIISNLSNPTLSFLACFFNNLGLFYDSLGEYNFAIQYLEKSLEMKIKLSFSDFSILMTKNNLHLSYLNQGKLKDAFEKTVEILEKITVDSHEERIINNTMGIVYFYKGQYIEAIQCFQKSYTSFNKHESENIFASAIVMGNMAAAFCDLGKYQKALSLHHETLKMIEKSRPKHPFIAFCFNNIGFICKFLGELAKALEYILKGYTVLREEIEDEHPDIAKIFNNIGIIYLKRANYEKALEYITHALKIGIKFYGSEHLEIAKYQNNIGLIFDQRGMKTDAIKHYEHALELYIKFFGENHPHVAVIYDNIGCVIADLGNYREGLIKYLRSLRIRIKTLRENDAYMASTFYDIGCLFREQKIFHWGINFYKKAYVCDLKNLGRNHFDTNLSDGNIKDLCVHNELNQDPIFQDITKLI